MLPYYFLQTTTERLLAEVLGRKVYRCAQQLTWSHCFPFALAAIASGVLTMPRATWVTPTAMPTTGSATTPATPEQYTYITQLVTAAKQVNFQPARLHQSCCQSSQVLLCQRCVKMVRDTGLPAAHPSAKPFTPLWTAPAIGAATRPTVPAIAKHTSACSKHAAAS